MLPRQANSEMLILQSEADLISVKDIIKVNSGFFCKSLILSLVKKPYSFCLWWEDNIIDMFVLTTVMSLRYYHGNLGVVHYVILIKWREIAAISVAVWWLGGGEGWWWWWLLCCSEGWNVQICEASTKCQVCCERRAHFPPSNRLSHWLSYWAAEVQCSGETRG